MFRLLASLFAADTTPSARPAAVAPKLGGGGIALETRETPAGLTAAQFNVAQAITAGVMAVKPQGVLPVQTAVTGNNPLYQVSLTAPKTGGSLQAEQLQKLTQQQVFAKPNQLKLVMEQQVALIKSLPPGSKAAQDMMTKLQGTMEQYSQAVEAVSNMMAKMAKTTNQINTRV